MPIIGIEKSDAPDTPVRITVTADDARALVAAGADIVACDATERPRQDSAEDVFNAIREAGALAMADCSTMKDGKRALSGGAAILGTTLSGYTDETACNDMEPDLDLVAAFHRLGFFVMAEGRFDTPDLAMAAIEAGANAVTVGSSLTRLEVVTERFARAVERGAQIRAVTGYAVDLGGKKTAAAHIVDGRITRQVQAPTDRSASADMQIDLMTRLLDQLGYQNGDRLGLAVTGRIDSQGNWYAVNRGTLEEINIVPLAMKLEDRFGPTPPINDAAAAALAEHRLGAGRGHENFAYITVSTGVGGGLILNGKLHRGTDGIADHIGFASTSQWAAMCGSGRVGTVENRAGGACNCRCGRGSRLSWPQCSGGLCSGRVRLCMGG